MPDVLGLLAGIGCAVGLWVSIVMLWPILMMPGRFVSIMERPSVIVTAGPFLIGPLGYLLVGWICVRHWKTVSQREVALMSAIAYGGTLLFLFSWRGPPPPGVQLVLCVGFWMLNGLGLAWLLRKLRRIMREANTE